MYAKKSLGQHFLSSKDILNVIRETAEVVGDDLILEIGPGKGDLTKILLFFAGKVIAVEKDDELYIELKEKFKKEIELGKLDLIHGDILEFDPGILSFYKDLTYKIVANIPYNITGAILRKFLSSQFVPLSMTLLVQKEVAERIVAKNKKESILSLSIKAYGIPKYIKTVKAGSFSPPPKVDSAILLVEKISKEFFEDFSEEEFFNIVRAGFKSKRKKLSSNLSGVYEKEKVLRIFDELKLDPNLRAEDLDPLGWQKISKLISRG